jgi:exodeoxyribonuclease X
MSGHLFAVLDTETTGTDPTKDQVIEFGFAVTDLDGILAQGSQLVRPTCPISPEASAVHHLIDEDVRDAGSLEDAIASARGQWTGCGEASAYVAQNAPFDKPFLPMLTDKPWLDTLRMGRRYLPELTCHSNQYLRYRLGLDVPRDIPAHRALGDCIVTSALLRYLLAGPARDDFERMGVVEFAKHVDSPMVLDTVNFGKYRDWKWANVPRDYLAWILAQGQFDPDVAFTARHYLIGPRPASQI